MKLIMNKTVFLFIALLCIALHASAQENNRIKLNGIVKNDSTYLQDINILNKATNLGVSSSKNGAFTIYAKEGDSIAFSSIVYMNRIIKISKTHINSKKIIVYLEPDYYQLNEVMLAKKVFINWRDAAVTSGTIFNNDKISNSKAPDARKLTDPNAYAGGLNPIALYRMFTKKGRLKRKERKLQQQEAEKLKNEFSSVIVNLYGRDFFKKELDISEDTIYLFLDYCENNGLLNFYKSDEFVIKNFLVNQSKKFNAIKN
jgi:hypothetical protein